MAEGIARVSHLVRWLAITTNVKVRIICLIIMKKIEKSVFVTKLDNSKLISIYL